MGGAEEEKQRIADLEKEIAKRNRWIDQRDRRIDKLEEENDRLRREIEKLQQAAKRQAAPFSRGEPKRNPKATRTKGRKAIRPASESPCASADRPSGGSACALVLH